MALSWSALGTAPSGARLERIKASPLYRDGRFVNSLPMEEFDFLKSLGEWVKGAKHTTPDGPVPVVRRGRGDFDSPPPGGLRVTWLGHSTALVEIDGLRLLLDPMWSQRSSPLSWAGPKRFFEPPLALDDLPPLDAVLISHDHFDHLDQATVRILAARGLPFIVPLGVGADLEYWGVASGQVTELEWWQTATVGSLTVTATPARHFSGRSPVMADRDRTLWTGFAIHGPQHRVYYSGDSGMFEGFREIGRRLGPFDIALLEVGAYNRLWADYHLGPEQAVEAALQVRARLMMPVHWATFDLALHSWTEPVERLLTAAADAGLPLSVPRPGQSIEPESPPELVRWWPELPWQTAAQHPIISSGLDPIARTDD